MNNNKKMKQNTQRSAENKNGTTYTTPQKLYRLHTVNKILRMEKNSK